MPREVAHGRVGCESGQAEAPKIGRRLSTKEAESDYEGTQRGRFSNGRLARTDVRRGWTSTALAWTIPEAANESVGA